MIPASVFAAIRQVLSPRLRGLVLRALGLTLLILFALWWGMVQGVGWWLERHPLSTSYPALDAVLQFAAGAGFLVVLLYLLPVASALVAGFFLDDAAEAVERSDFPGDPPGMPLTIGRSLLYSLRFAGLTLAVNLAALLLIFVPGVNVVAFFAANSYLLGREYFEMAAARFRPLPEAGALRRSHRATTLAAGTVLAALMLVPVLNLVTPIFGIAYMVHLHKRVVASDRRALRAAT